ncbi:Uncharacterized protein APZ42_001092 [Daphnia magna]|uniref:Uncharacterized protein n=1 Tax=Daphnia magna TaxID=35525 RepID=A0A164J6F5_9CRUS|nr:Uncharacterized protein APZ42_001092 [Daphnia magna]
MKYCVLNCVMQHTNGVKFSLTNCGYTIILTTWLMVTIMLSSVNLLLQFFNLVILQKGWLGLKRSFILKN